MAQRLVRGAIYAIVFGVVLGLLPFTASPSSDIKYLLLGVAAPLLTAIASLSPNSRALFTPRTPIASLLYLFVLANIVTALLSEYPLNALYSASHLVVLTALFASTAFAFRTSKSAYTLVKAISLAVLCSSAYGFIQKGGLDPFPWAARDMEEYWNLPATFGNPNIAAYSLVLALILSLSLALRAGSRWYALVAAIILAHIYMTKVRSGLLALFFSAVLVTSFSVVNRRLNSSALTPLFTLLATLGVGLGTCGVIVAAFYIRTGAILPTDGSLILRYNSNLSASRMFFDNPLCGFGPGNYLINNPPYWTDYEQLWFATKNMFNAHVHNDFLETAVESGVLGLALHVSFLAALVLYALHLGCIARDRNTRRISISLAACFVAFATDGIFGFNIRTPVSSALLFLLAGTLEGLLLSAMHARPPTSKSYGALALHYTALFLSVLAALLIISGFKSQFLLQKATAAKYWGYPDVARQFLYRARFYAPWNFTIPMKSGEIALSQHRPDIALDEFKRAIDLNANWVPAHTWLAQAHLIRASALDAGEDRLWEIDQAKAAIDTALRLCPGQPFAEETRGALWLMRAETAGNGEAGTAARRTALECFQLALQNTAEDADRSRLSLKSATTFRDLGELSEAAHAYDAAVEQDPANDLAWRHYFEFADNTKRLDKILVALNTARTRLEFEASNHSDALATVCVLLSRTKRQMQQDGRADAEPAQRAVALAPDRLEAWRELAMSQPRVEWKNIMDLAATTAQQHSADRARPLPPTLLAIVGLWNTEKPDPIDEVQQVSRTCIEYVHTKGVSNASEDCGWIVDYAWELARGKTTTIDVQTRISSILKGTADLIGRQDLSKQFDSRHAQNDEVSKRP